MTQLERCAAHEAAHALVAFIYRRAIQKIEISSDGLSGSLLAGTQRHARSKFSSAIFTQLAHEEISVAIAGEIGEELADPASDLGGSAVDVEIVRKLIVEIGMSPDQLEQLAAEVKEILSAPSSQRALAKIRSILIRTGHVFGPCAEAIFRENGVRQRAFRFPD